ncbi:MAG: DEAD/DEAH box helicase family protein [Deltaproteobacteria bacterium]|jgi:type III restriction enzyme|nr:DEAD/DEAH box helicase family protein [Deltaproteobacteria bacterium]
MNRAEFHTIERCLSLRRPQSEALGILAEVAELLPLSKKPDLVRDLAAITERFPTVDDFERGFPSLCFALATGVGKTRLMGAFIAYLHLSKGFCNFLVLAPNLTIYNKLIADFTPNTPKYVFAGLSRFSVNPPEIITGDNYGAGKGFRDGCLFGADLRINIFNISKINSEVRGDNPPRMKRLMETLGESYFSFLAGLPDLVLLMDEAHRYRATAGLNAINELKPVLGLELTATPQIENGQKSTPFRNVIYSYPLPQAMEDGFIKEPAVATRDNFNAELYNEEQLERLKLEDGTLIHETVKTELAVHAANHDLKPVKPFMLVVAQNTAHAESLQKLIESHEFFEGRYQGRVITVHSAQRGEEKDETVERLLDVENPDEPTEIVIHVNMLKEGWDVTNLYTIVPLRTANSRTLVEQSIGRGLRLPYGKKVGVAALDRLTIVAHDRFDEIIREASDRKSLIRTGLVIGCGDLDEKPKMQLKVASNLDLMLGTETMPFPPELFEKPAAGFTAPPTPQISADLQAADNLETVRETLAVIKTLAHEQSLPSAQALAAPETRAEIIQKVTENQRPAQDASGDFKETAPVAAIVDQLTRTIIDNSINLPHIIVAPEPGVNYTFKPFRLDTSGLDRLTPMEQDILIQHLRTAERDTMTSRCVNFINPRRPADHLVTALINCNDIIYEEHGDLLHDLADQMVTHLRGYLTAGDDLLNVLQFYQKELAAFIHAQMQDHYQSGPAGFTAMVTEGFYLPPPYSCSLPQDEMILYFRHPVADKSTIKSLAFQGFAKCLYPVQKFDSDAEREFAVLLEDEPKVQKWFRPGRRDFYIYYAAESRYEPDFVVELDDLKLLCEPKMKKDMASPEVQAKAEAARHWCQAATAYELAHGGKPWSYLLVPDTEIKPRMTLEGLMKRYNLNSSLYRVNASWPVRPIRSEPKILTV